MPLKRGRSRQVIEANICELISAGYPQRQAVAIVMERAGKRRQRRRRVPGRRGD